MAFNDFVVKNFWIDVQRKTSLSFAKKKKKNGAYILDQILSYRLPPMNTS
jgi:hypothetical protein